VYFKNQIEITLKEGDFGFNIHICHQELLPFVSIQLHCLNMHYAGSLQDYQGQIRHPPKFPKIGN
jgi:hypothetical protein